jgi:hypothetical protein
MEQAIKDTERDADFWRRFMRLWESEPNGDVPGDEIWALVEAYKAGVKEPPLDLKAEFERRIGDPASA